jgi:hypothetical protein
MTVGVIVMILVAITAIRVELEERNALSYVAIPFLIIGILSIITVYILSFPQIELIFNQIK